MLIYVLGVLCKRYRTYSSVALYRDAVGWSTCVMVIFPDHNHLLFMSILKLHGQICFVRQALFHVMV